jgi:hypothetical protein
LTWFKKKKEKKKYGVSNAGNIINNYYKRLENLRISKINELKGY